MKPVLIVSEQYFISSGIWSMAVKSLNWYSVFPFYGMTLQGVWGTTTIPFHLVLFLKYIKIHPCPLFTIVFMTLLLSTSSSFPFTVPLRISLQSQKTLRCGQTTFLFNGHGQEPIVCSNGCLDALGSFCEPPH